MTATKHANKTERRQQRMRHAVQTAPNVNAALAAAYDAFRVAAAQARKRGHHGAVQTMLGASPASEYGALGSDVDAVVQRVTEWLVEAATECDELAVP